LAPPEIPHTTDVGIDASHLSDVDCGTVDALARLQLAARRLGWRIVLYGPSLQLRELIALAGLSDVLPAASGLSVKSKGEAEEREEVRCVEEETDPGDAIT
jgi:anti-anti-sigma regulatory factor